MTSFFKRLFCKHRWEWETYPPLPIMRFNPAKKQFYSTGNAHQYCTKCLAQRTRPLS